MIMFVEKPIGVLTSLQIWEPFVANFFMFPFPLSLLSFAKMRMEQLLLYLLCNLFSLGFNYLHFIKHVLACVEKHACVGTHSERNIIMVRSFMRKLNITVFFATYVLVAILLDVLNMDTHWRSNLEPLKIIFFIPIYM